MERAPTRSIRRKLRDFVGNLFGRSFIEAGGTGKRWPSTGMRRPASEVQRRAEMTGARVAGLAMNSPYGRAIADAWVSNLVGDGPSVRPSTTDKAVKRQLLAVYNRFWRECDAEGLMALDGLLQAITRSLVLFGESFIHMSADPETGALRLRLWSVEQVDRSRNIDLGHGAKISAGIEFNAVGRRVAYHVRENPDTIFATPYGTKRVPAEDVIHLFEPLFPGQVRGISWLTASATRLTEVDRLEDALLAKFNTSALFGGVLTKPNADDAKIFKTDDKGDMALEPGGMMIAPPGYTFDNVDAPNTEGAVDFLRSQIRSAAIGAGVPYELASGDLSQVNYSSARLGLMEFRRRVVALQKSLIVGRLLNSVWRRMLLLEGLADRLPLASAMTVEAEFVFTGWAPIDPLKETNADIRAIEARTKSRFEVIAARGRDPESVDEEIDQDAGANPKAAVPAEA